MRFFNCFVNSLLLISVPSIAIPQPMTSFQIPIFGELENDIDDLNFSYDDILDLIERIESGEFAKTCTPEEIERINQVLAYLARQGLISADPEDQKELEEDIEELLDTESNMFSFQQGNDYVILPSVFYGRERNVILCRSWLDKKRHQIGKFVRHHKKEILIGAAVVAAVAAVVVVATAAAACTAASAAAGAVVSSADKEQKHHHEPKEEPQSAPIISMVDVSTQLQVTIKENVEAFKELVVEENLLPEKLTREQSRTFGEKARDLGAYLAHETLEGAVDLAIVVPEKVRAVAHERIDEIFSTEQAGRYSPEVKANSVMDNFDVGIIPVPGLLTGSGTTAGRSVKTEVNAVKGWSIGCPIENLTAFGTTPTWTSVRRRYWKNQAEKAQVNPTAYEYNATQIERMKKGLAPQRENPITGEIETMELHHIPPRREGGLFDFEELWPDQHAAVDEFRRLGK